MSILTRLHSPAGRCFHMDYTAAQCCQSPRCWSSQWSCCPCCIQHYSSVQIGSWQCCHPNCWSRNFPSQKKSRSRNFLSRSCHCFPHCSSGRACSWQCCPSGSCHWCRSHQTQTAPTKMGSCPLLESTHYLCRSPEIENCWRVPPKWLQHHRPHPLLVVSWRSEARALGAVSRRCWASLVAPSMPWLAEPAPVIVNVIDTVNIVIIVTIGIIVFVIIIIFIKPASKRALTGIKDLALQAAGIKD